MRVAREETFAPFASVFKFETVDEVIQLANNTEFDEISINQIVKKLVFLRAQRKSAGF